MPESWQRFDHFNLLGGVAFSIAHRDHRATAAHGLLRVAVRRIYRQRSRC
jgi:hypothetical protein